MLESFFASLGSGAFYFGFVVGFFAYRVVKHVAKPAISDLAAVVAAIGGAAVLKLFPAESARFDAYAYGLAFGVLLYLVLSVALGLWKGDKAADILLGRE
jgi:hypothetical protein